MKRPFIQSLGIENLRIFKEYTEFEFRPITILTGPNSSGKSTLIKALLLLKEAFKHSDLPNFDFENGEHNLGSFEKAFCKEKNEEQHNKKDNNSNNQGVFISFPLNEKYYDQTIHCAIFIKEGKFPENMKLFLAYEKSNKLTPLIKIQSSYLREYTDNEGVFGISLSLKNIIEIINNKEIRDEMDGGFIRNNFKYGNILHPGIIECTYHDGTKENIDLLGFELNEIHTDTVPVAESHEIASTYNLDAILNNIQYDECRLIDDLKDFLGQNIESTKFWAIIKAMGLIGFIITEVGHIFNIMKETVKSFQNESLKYIPAPTGNYERLILQPKFHKLIEKYHEMAAHYTVDCDLANFINEWTGKFGIKGEFKVQKVDEGFRAYFENEKTKTELLDLGFGISKLLTIILNVGVYGTMFKGKKTTTFLIEEPETHLHPKLQSMLAEFFIYSMNLFELNFIIETHSEYLMRKLQYYIAYDAYKDPLNKPIVDRLSEAFIQKKIFTDDGLRNLRMDDMAWDNLWRNMDIKPQDAIIYYFHDPNNIPENTPLVKTIYLDEYGKMSDSFGPGFFDEADNLAISLFNINQNRQN